LAATTLAAGARTRPHYGGTLRAEIAGDPWQRPGGLARSLVFDGLTGMGADGALPALAAEWKTENNDHRWEFRLRPGVQFHDGSPLTASAVVAALTSACAADCPWTAIHAVGVSVVFLGDAPMPNLPELLAGDDYLISAAGINGAGGLVGTGPFRPAGFNNGVLTLAANDNCWQGRPFVDAVEIHVRRPIREQWLDLGVGRADLVEVPAEQLRQAQQQRLTVVASPPVTLLALQLRDSGLVLGNPNLRAAIANAIDRSALSNVIFQKQGEVTASLLPAALTGYSFLFSTERNLNKAHELRGGLNPPQLTLAAESDGAMQLAAQRIALNLREAGFNVLVVGIGGPPRADLFLRGLTLECSRPQPALESMMRAVGQSAPVEDKTSVGLYSAEREFLDRHMLIPLLFLPRAYAIAGRVRDLRLGPDGAPLLAGVSVEDGQ
jgi:MarR-like DNA-binding transcriptional regulator SgrR of sgrS sRNA